MTEINSTHYCSASAYVKGLCHDEDDCIKHLCKNYHRKHPTPEQFEAEYQRPYPDNAAIYYFKEGFKHWKVGKYNGKVKHDQTLVVCACTPWGKPLADWRPE